MTLIELQPGDVLLYRGVGIIGWAIRTKTWSRVSHVETFIGDGKTAASRDGLGVETYNLYPEVSGKRTLEYVLRPNVPFDFAAGLAWHETVRGQKYDLLGLFFSFFSQKGGSSDKMFCSEHTSRMANRMGYFPFGEFDCDKVSPGMFLASPLYTTIFRRSLQREDEPPR